MNATLKAGCSHSLMLDEQMEAHLLDLLKQLVIPSAWGVKEKCLQQLAPLINQQPNELQEALLLAGPTTVLDSILAVIVSQRTELSSKLLAADVLSEVCSSCSKACLLLCPSNLVERLMRCASKGDGDMKAAAARALWQLSCHHDFSPEVVSHAGNAFKVVDLLAEDMQQGSSSTCMCALRATQNLLQAYIAHGAGDAGDRIGGRIVEPLSNLLEASHPEAAAAAAELLALLCQSAPNRARIVAAGGIQRLVMLMRQASSNCSTLAATCSADTQQEQQAAIQLQEAAAAQALHALAQLARGDNKLCLELLGAHVMPGLLQLLHLKGCCAGALGLIGDLVALPEGRRALQYADGLAALAEVAQVCPEPLMCRLLSKATKGCTLLSHDLAGLVASPALLAVLVHCCGTTDRKTRKRAMQVVGRLLEHSRATGRSQYLQSQMLTQGLLQQLQTVLSSLLPHRPAAANSNNNSLSSSVLELQLALNLLLGLATSTSVLTVGATAAASSTQLRSVAEADQQADQHAGKQQQPVSQLSAALNESSQPVVTAYLPADAAAEAIMADPSAVWKHPAAAAAAFGDLGMLVPELHGSSKSTAQQQHQQQAKPADAGESNNTLASILWLLQQLLLSPQHQLPSLQQQVLQVVCELAAHRQQQLLQLMVKQGWVQLLWSFLPGGRQLLAVTLSHLIEQHSQEQQEQQVHQKVAAAAAKAIPATPWPAATGAYPPIPGQDTTAAAATNSKAPGLQPQLLQLLDESLPSIEQTLHALQALAHLCCCSTAAVVAVQLQASYQAIAAIGMLSVRPSSHMLHQQTSAGTAATPTAASNPAAAVVAMLFGGGSSPRAAVAVGKGGTTGHRSHSQPPSPSTLPSTPLSFASSSSGSSTASSVMGSYGAAAAPSVISSSLPSSSMLSGSVRDSSGDGSSSAATAGSNNKILRSSSSGLLSRLGMGRKDAGSSNQPKGQQAAAVDVPTASITTTTAPTDGNQAAPGITGRAAAVDPVEDPGSPIEMLVTLLGEQWAATAAAELLARLAAAGPAICVPAMIEQGTIGTLTECMKEIQDNSAGAVAAMAALLLVKELSSHCPEQLHASGIVSTVLRMLVQGCGGSEAVQRAALGVVEVLCQQGDRQISAAVAQASLLPLVRWLSSGKDQAMAAAVLTALLDIGAIDEAVLAALQEDNKASELLQLCLGCLGSGSGSSSNSSSASASSKEGAASSQPQQEQQQQQLGAVQLTAIRLLRSCVELEGRLVDAFLAADGLRTLLSLLSVAAAAGGSKGWSPAAAESGNAPAVEHHSRMVLQYECLAILDSLSLVHRRVLVEAAIIPIIVGVLRQQQVDAAAADAAPGTPPAAAMQPSRSGNNRLGLTRTTSSHSSSSSRGLARSSSKAPGAAAGLSARVMTPAELLLRCKVIACNLITVLAINNDVKRQLFHSDAVGPLMQLADVVAEGSSAQEAIRAALAQLGLVYLLPAGSTV